MLCLGGIPFEVFPEARLSADEHAALKRLGQMEAGALPPFRLELVPSPPWTSADPSLFADRAPAVISWTEGVVRASHHSFVAALDPFGNHGSLFRHEPWAFPLEITLRTAMACRLPLAGGVPLHAAGLAIDGRGVAFFGVSGAGKSTLAGLAPFPVLSDEVVAVVADRNEGEAGGPPFALVTTGFWGTLGRANAPRQAFPLRALVELDKGPDFRLDPLPPREAVRRLIGSCLVPPVPPLWSRALAVVGRLVREVPVYRMAWSPQAPPWEPLRSRLIRE
jgi:hypothetical protein